jgi:hypothetical protein
MECIGDPNTRPGLLRKLQADAGHILGNRPADGGKPGGGPGRGTRVGYVNALAEQAGLDPETIEALREDLKAAIVGAMGDTEADGTTGDPREAVRSAIRDTLRGYGIEPEHLRPDVAVAGAQGIVGGPGMPDRPAGSDSAALSGSEAQPADDRSLISLLELLGLVDEQA